MNLLRQLIYLISVLMSTQVVLLKQHRSRRFLIFPHTSPTRIQIITGIGLPVDLNLETVTIGYVFKALFYIPDNVTELTNFIADPFEVSTHPITSFDRKKRVVESTEKSNGFVSGNRGFDNEQNEKFERYEAEAEVVESGTENVIENGSAFDDILVPENSDYRDDPMASKSPQNVATSRWTLYKAFASIAESKGLQGKPCVLRSICEAAHTPFDYSNGILGELMHIVMTPSNTRDEIIEHSDLEYYQAERLGTEGVPCDRVFKECSASMLDQFSGIYTPAMDLFNKI